MDLDAILKAKGTSLDALRTRQAELKTELNGFSQRHSKRKSLVKQQLYCLEDFLYANSTGKIELRKNELKQFFWDKFKEDSGGIRLSPWQRTGGWVYDGVYLGCSFYSLWMSLHNRFNTLVYLNKDGKTCHLFSKRKDSPLELKEQKLNIQLTKEVLFSLNNNDICTSRGVVLFGDNREYALEIFTKVLNGEEILPKPKNGKTYTQKNKKGGESENIKPRTFGQRFLQELNPINIIQGQVLGSGSSYKAYIFGDKVIVEADETARATYFFTTQEFETLRHKSRSEILELNPEGFCGRVIHCNNETEQWKSSVQEYLANE